jgi:ankyrin repeat protein
MKKTTNKISAVTTAIELSKSGDSDGISKWLDSNNDPNQYDQNGWTPLLWACDRGNTDVVKLLIKGGASVAMPHKISGASSVHLAGQKGSVEVSAVLLDAKPQLLNAIWELNGHSILLQAVFYGHLELADYLVKRGADTSITTARGLGAMEFAAQFQNSAMMDIIRPYDSLADAKAVYYRCFLKRIAPVIANSEKERQNLSDQLIDVIMKGLKKAASDPSAIDSTLNAARDLIEVKHADINRLGGALQQPPLIAAATGTNSSPDVLKLRNQLAQYLLDKGANPTLHEEHPMGVQTIIRAAVFNHLDILKMCAKKMTPKQLAEAINEIPVANGLTAMHDTVLRGSMVKPENLDGYLDQIRFFVSNGGRTDIPDFAGLTQRNYAENAANIDTRKRLLEVIDEANKNTGGKQ